MKFIPARIPEVIVIEPKVFGDDRGFFFESYRQDIFRQNGITDDFVQDNHSLSAKGVLRGLHYQIAPTTQAKLVRVLRGEAFDVALDIRKNSKTFGQYVGEFLSAKNKKMMYVPKGFAHGFLSMEEGTEFMYQVSDIYSPKDERGIIWNDPGVGVQWPKLDIDYILSDKDKKNPPLSQAKDLF